MVVGVVVIEVVGGEVVVYVFVPFSIMLNMGLWLLV